MQETITLNGIKLKQNVLSYIKGSLEVEHSKNKAQSKALILLFCPILSALSFYRCQLWVGLACLLLSTCLETIIVAKIVPSFCLTGKRDSCFHSQWDGLLLFFCNLIEPNWSCVLHQYTDRLKSGSLTNH